MDTQTQRGVLIETDAATKIYLMQQKLDYIDDVDETSVFIRETSYHNPQMNVEDKIAYVKKLVIDFKNKYSYEKPDAVK